MFRVDNVPLVLRKMTIKLEDNEDEGCTDRICEITFRMPLLLYDMAHAIGVMPVARHCFGADQLPLWDVNDVWFTPPSYHYLVEIRTAPDMPAPLVTLDDAAIDSCRVFRPKKDKRDLMLDFVTKHTLSRGDVKDLADVLVAWETSRVYLTPTEIRPPLLVDDDAQPRPRRTAH